MHPARIAELLEPFLNGQDQRPNTKHLIPHILTYIDLLRRWNARINLTAIRDPEEIVTRHFGESLFTARRLFPSSTNAGTAALGCPAERSAAAVRSLQGDRKEHGFSFHLALSERGESKGADLAALRDGALAAEGNAEDLRANAQHHPTVADLGSGAGFPGIPIKLWAPNISLTLIESNRKKAAFLREVVRALTLTNVNVQTARAETLPAGVFDLVTLRAVERFSTILPIAANLVAPAGRLALLIGTAQLAQAQSALPYFLWHAPEPIPLSKSRILAVCCRPSGH